MENKTIIVPWDYTDKANFAFQHALYYSEHVGTNITLLHVVKKETEVLAAQSKLDKEALKLHTGSINVKAIVHYGSIFNVITEYADKVEAELVVMGTHGIKGMQKYFGSYALKVLSSSMIPYLVVQAPPSYKEETKVLYPVNFRKENKELITWINHMAKFFKLNIHIFFARYTDKKLKNKANSNVFFAKQIFEKKHINYSIKASSGEKDFNTETLDYCQEIDADLILVMATRDITLADFLIGAHEQNIIANPLQKPVLCMNPKPLKNVGGFVAGGG